MDEDQQSRASLGRVAVLSRDALERAVLTAGAVAFFVTGYFAVGYSVDPGRARILATALDARIPFIAPSVWVYLWAFPASLLPLFLVRCPRLFRRTIAAYAVAIAASLALFAAVPVTSLGLRADFAALDVKRFSPWAVRVLYRLDPPYNLFPSLHLSLAALAASSALRASKLYGAAAFAGVALIAVSICTVKQHYVLDGIAGLALAAIVHALILRPYAPAPGVDSAYGWRGPAVYVALLALVYAGFYAAFLAA